MPKKPTHQNLMTGTIRRLLQREAWHNIQKVLEKLYPADISLVMRDLDAEMRLNLFRQIKNIAKAAETLSELDIEIAIPLVQTLPEKKVGEIFKKMSDDDRAEIISRLPDDFARQILDQLGTVESQDVETLLSYPEDSAGRIMTTDFFALRDATTATEAIEIIRRRGEEAETVFYIYVTDPLGRLIGIVSLRKLILTRPETPLKDIMNTNVVKVGIHTDQEFVAQQVERYNILAIPVVDEANTLVGIITVDDIIDVIRQEATEDIFRMAGTDSMEIVYADNIWKISRIRLPWLIITLMGGIVTGYFMWLFKATLQTTLTLVTFVPVITGMGGNVGTQSSSIIVRGLATGRVTIDSIAKVIWREARIGILMGIFCGLSVGIVALIWHHEAMVGIVVAFAMSASMTVAATMGAFAPTVFHKLDIDPAIASGPFVTTSNDIIGILIYMGTATLFLKYFS
ncbi:MAG: magnesium transporter [Deltaproteobacteria bacterium]|nr:magnesium transporter [Deltaproteobacteria bacterium]